MGVEIYRRVLQTTIILMTTFVMCMSLLVPQFDADDRPMAASIGCTVLYNGR